MAHSYALLSSIRYLKNSLGGPTKAEFDNLLAEKESIQTQLDDAKATIEKLQAEVRDPNPMPWVCFREGPHGMD